MGNIKVTKRTSSSTEFISKPVIINNTISQNLASSSGGGISTAFSSPIVVNSILWSDSASAGSEVRGSIEIRYSDIKGGYSGTGNIDVDPLFADPLFNLSQSSPCVGAGVDSIQIAGTWYYAPSTDFANNPRPNSVDYLVDMGALESSFPNGIIKENSDYLPKTFSLKQNYPNPFNPSTTIEFSIPKAEFATLKIYNLLGQEVATLVSEKLTHGKYKYIWDASAFASGLYYYKIEAGDPSAGFPKGQAGQRFNQTRKMILLR